MKNGLKRLLSWLIVLVLVVLGREIAGQGILRKWFKKKKV